MVSAPPESYDVSHANDRHLFRSLPSLAVSGYSCPCGCTSTSYQRDPDCILSRPLPVHHDAPPLPVLLGEILRDMADHGDLPPLSGEEADDGDS